ncbi:MAG TPA: hypothetical protein DCR48_09305 [Flavobacteriales bacterium]|nr:hypothetical protein [Flavobacteriales bacterium]
MEEQKVIELIAEALEVGIETIASETLLDDLEEYDSMGKLSIIVILDEEYDKSLSGEEMASFKTVSDIISFALK